MTDRWFDATNKTYVDFTPEKQAEVDAYKQDLIDRSKDRKLESIRQLRLKKLEETDWMASNDVTMPENIKTWRQELRDLPTTVTKPSFETLNNQSFKEWNINSLMPTKPE